MKVLVVASSAFPRWKDDPMPAFVHGLCVQLLRKGAGVAVLAPHHPGAKCFEFVDGMRVHRFRYFFPSSLERLCYDGGILPNMKKSFLARLQLPLLVVSEFFALLRVARIERPDIIHAHWILPQGFTAALADKLLGIPVVVTAHAGDVFPLNKPLFRMLSRFSINSAAAVTANSSFTKAAVENISAKKADVIPMGVDISLFSSSSASAVASVRKKYSIKGKMLLFVGRLAEKKCVAYLISAMKSVIGEFPDCKLVIVGDGPEKKALVSQVQHLGLWGNIVFAGSLPNRELPPYYRAADAFILPSIVDSRGDTEGLGVVLLEAIAAGTPVIASSVGGIPDIVIDSRTGLLVRQKNPEQLASAIKKLLGSKVLSRRLSAAAKNHIAKKYSWQEVGSGFYSLLSSVLSGKEK